MFSCKESQSCKYCGWTYFPIQFSTQAQNCSSFHEHSRAEGLLGGCICAADLEKGTTAKLKTNPSTFTGPTEAERCVCFIQQVPWQPSGCFRCIKHHPESPGQFLIPPKLSSVSQLLPHFRECSFPSSRICSGTQFVSVSVTIATPHLTSPCTKNRSP